MADVKVGDEVLAPWMNDGFVYPAVMVEVRGASAHVAYLDGDEGDVPLQTLRRSVFGGGMAVQVNWKGKGQYFNGVIQKRIGSALYLHYEDGDKGWTTLGQCRVAEQALAAISEEQAACSYCGAPVHTSAPQCNYCGTHRGGR
jgi:hypothetical protein